MAKIYKIKSDGKTYFRLRDVAGGRWFQYLVNLGNYTEKQWLKAHGAVMLALTPEQRGSASNKQIKEYAMKWLNSSKESREAVKAAGVNMQALNKSEATIEAVFESYLKDLSAPGVNSNTTIERARRQCGMLLIFIRETGTKEYSKLQRETFAKYPEWRNSHIRYCTKSVASADTVNQELNRMASVIKHGVKFHDWRERYLLDGIRVKPTQQNTKSVRPFSISETKTILEWLRKHSEAIGGWHLHDMILLALCTGLEAKALDKLSKDWFKIDLGILRVYDKLISGVLDAKTQNRARDIPLCMTLRKLHERGFIFKRDSRARHKSVKGGTEFRAWSETLLEKAEKDTGIADINLHRFRHTCATMRLSAGWQLIRVSRMLGHSTVNTTAKHYAEYDLSASTEGFEGMVKVYGDFVRWVDEGYFG